MSLAVNPTVEKSLRRLRAMGLRCELVPEGDDAAYIYISLDSLLKLISSKITYPNKKVMFEEGFIIIKVWRG